MLTEAERAGHLAAIEADGYTIVEDAIDSELVDALAGALDELERVYEIVPARNDFEGAHTVRIYNLLALDRVFEQVPTHEHVLPIVEGVLDPGCLISSLSSISIGPGETPQPIHADDQLIPLDKPHVATVCNTMWALTDFTPENGATRIVVGSHRSDANPTYGAHYETVPATMTRGSVLLWHGSLWHGGGANVTDERRVGIAMNYCAGFIRQQENQQLGIPREVAARFSPRLQALCGYRIYNGLIGHINKAEPAEMLGAADDATMIWDVV